MKEREREGKVHGVGFVKFFFFFFNTEYPGPTYVHLGLIRTASLTTVSPRLRVRMR